MLRILSSLVLVLVLYAPCLAQPGGCVCPPGGSSPTGPSGPSINAPPVLGPDRDDPGGDGQPEGPDATEEPVGDFSEWLENNPDSPLNNLAGQAAGDSGLQNVLGQLTPSELNNLGNLLTTYQNGINKYIKDNPRTWDTAGGGMRNFLNSLSALAGNDPFVRGCADMSERTVNILGPLTGGKNPFTVHEYNWVPGTGRQVGAYFGAPIVTIMVVKGAAGGTCLGGPLGTVVGGGTGLVIGLASGSTEHNMAALQSTRNPKLVIVLDPHGVQTGNPESVHGPGHYSGMTGNPTLGPAKVPAAQSGTNSKIERGSLVP